MATIGITTVRDAPNSRISVFLGICAFGEDIDAAMSVAQNCPIPAKIVLAWQNPNLERIAEIRIQADKLEVTLIFVEGKGVSRNRNSILKWLEAEVGWLIFADSDFEFTSQASETVAEILELPERAMIALTRGLLSGTGANYKNYPPCGAINMTRILSPPPSTIELCVRLPARINFDESLGLGTTIPMGEEPKFVEAHRRLGLPIYRLGGAIFQVPDESDYQTFSLYRLIARLKIYGFWVTFLEIARRALSGRFPN